MRPGDTTGAVFLQWLATLLAKMAQHARAAACFRFFWGGACCGLRYLAVQNIVLRCKTGSSWMEVRACCLFRLRPQANIYNIASMAGVTKLTHTPSDPSGWMPCNVHSFEAKNGRRARNFRSTLLSRCRHPRQKYFSQARGSGHSHPANCVFRSSQGSSGLRPHVHHEEDGLNRPFTALMTKLLLKG